LKQCLHLAGMIKVYEPKTMNHFNY